MTDLKLLLNDPPCNFKDRQYVLRFLLVGLSGVFVNSIMLYVLTEWAGWFYIVSSIIATECAIISNYTLNDIWTFADREHRKIEKSWVRFLYFNAISFGGMIINVGVLFFITEKLGLWYMYSNIWGIAASFIWNIYWNNSITWKCVDE